MDRITTPWTAEQVADLNAHQRSGRFHPFTCGGDRGDAAHRAYAAENGDTDDGLLVAYEDGWRCPVCDYHQAWAWAGMAAPEFAPEVTPLDRLKRTDTIVAGAELREILGLEDDQNLDPVIGTCAGEWRREPLGWRAWSHDEDDSDVIAAEL
jgi:hypothetical protein